MQCSGAGGRQNQRHVFPAMQEGHRIMCRKAFSQGAVRPFLAQDSEAGGQQTWCMEAELLSVISLNNSPAQSLFLLSPWKKRRDRMSKKIKRDRRTEERPWPGTQVTQYCHCHWLARRLGIVFIVYNNAWIIGQGLHYQMPRGFLHCQMSFSCILAYWEGRWLPLLLPSV